MQGASEPNHSHNSSPLPSSALRIAKRLTPPPDSEPGVTRIYAKSNRRHRDRPGLRVSTTPGIPTWSPTIVLTWPLVIRWLHDALIEDAFDKTENHFLSQKKVTSWSAWVKFLRWLSLRFSKLYVW